jgi:tRNA (guanine-N7-)-methyltransferase
VEVIRRLAPATLSGAFIFFPDPWPKKRHHKRRLVAPAFLNLLATRLKRGARLYLATDWDDYAAAMLAACEANPDFRNAAGAGRTAPRLSLRPLTRFEARGTRLGHRIHDFTYLRTGDCDPSLLVNPYDNWAAPW